MSSECLFYLDEKEYVAVSSDCENNGITIILIMIMVAPWNAVAPSAGCISHNSTLGDH